MVSSPGKPLGDREDDKHGLEFKAGWYGFGGNLGDDSGVVAGDDVEVEGFGECDAGLSVTALCWAGNLCNVWEDISATVSCNVLMMPGKPKTNRLHREQVNI